MPDSMAGALRSCVRSHSTGVSSEVLRYTLRRADHPHPAATRHSSLRGGVQIDGDARLQSQKSPRNRFGIQMFLRWTGKMPRDFHQAADTSRQKCLRSQGAKSSNWLFHSLRKTERPMFETTAWHSDKISTSAGQARHRCRCEVRFCGKVAVNETEESKSKRLKAEPSGSMPTAQCKRRAPPHICIGFGRFSTKPLLGSRSTLPSSLLQAQGAGTKLSTRVQSIDMQPCRVKSNQFGAMYRDTTRLQLLRPSSVMAVFRAQLLHKDRAQNPKPGSSIMWAKQKEGISCCM